MIKNLDNDGLQKVAQNYDLFYIDIWGVLHNGIELYKQAVNTLEKLDEYKKEFVLLTNAPRPKTAVKAHLSSFGIFEEHFKGNPQKQITKRESN